MEVGGSDAEGREYRNAKEMWREEIGEGGENKKEWYQKGVGYWEGIEASVDGVLGGYGHVNDPDVKGSEAFLKALLANRIGGVRPNNLVALDCGSGIGRVTGNLLLRYFNEVDLVEPVSHFLEAAREKLAPEKCITNMHRAVNFYCVPLQEFTPEVGRYDVIWVQWCIGHLADDDFVAFFKRAKDFCWIKRIRASPDVIYISRSSSTSVDCISYRQRFRGGCLRNYLLCECMHWLLIHQRPKSGCNPIALLSSNNEFF
ncbi:alpha amino-terminal protein methyltransferase isoform X2 [Tasmannia lanceolata]|uniref:alpha amino-terminal protein methyltransferase isoform X2 n=1 Tax=Tasmannia lanceolata TaxID=3420 RepID=UPI004063DAE8